MKLGVTSLGQAAVVGLACLFCFGAGYWTATIRAGQISVEERLSALESALAGRSGVGPGRPVRPPAPEIPTEPQSLDGARLKGRSEARVVMIEYSDFECPFCSAFTQTTLPVLERQYLDAGTVQLAFRHLPLSSLHANALKAGEAAECAGQQDRFWEMHDLLFQTRSALDLVSLRVRAESLDLDLPEFDRCMEGRGTIQVRRDASSATILGITGTPTFLFGLRQPDGTVKISHRLSGAKPLAEFTAILDELLAQAN